MAAQNEDAVSSLGRLQRQMAANTLWANVPDRTAFTAPGRRAFEERFVRLVDPDGTLDPVERAKRAANARRAHFQGMALKSVQSRKKTAAARKREVQQ